MPLMPAQTLIWDGSSVTSGPQNGSDQWLGRTTGTNPNPNPWWDGIGNVSWDNSGSAIAQFGTTGSALVTGNTVTITGSTVNVAGLNYMAFASSPTTSGNQYTLAGASGGTLNFSASNAVLNYADNTSTGTNFVTYATTLAITGNGLTLQKSGGTAQQFIRFDMTSNPGLTGELLLRGDSGGLFVRSGAPGTFSAMTSVTVQNNSSFSMIGAGNYSVPLTIAGFGGAGNYGAIRVDTSNINITAPITLSADAAIQTNTGGTTGTIVSGGISGNFAFTRFATGSGLGTFILNNANTYTGATTLGRVGNFAGGITILDFSGTSAPNADVIYSGVPTAGGLNLIGGNNSQTLLNLNGKASTANTQRFGDVNLSAASSTVSSLVGIQLTSGSSGSVNLSLGAIARTGVVMATFAAPVTGEISTSTAPGFMGPWATFRRGSGDTSWAQVSGGVITGGFFGDLKYVTGTAISALENYSADKHLTVTSGSTGAVTVTGTTTDISTVSMIDPCFDRTINLGGNTLRLGTGATGGGIQLAASARNLTISGGSLTGGGTTLNTAGQIILTNNSAVSTLQIDANIVNNGSGAIQLLFNGLTNSKVVLTGTNTYGGGTTVASGAVELRSAGALGTAGTVTVFEGAALQLSGGITVSRTLSVGGQGIANNGVLRNLSGNNLISGIVTTNAPSRVHVDEGTLTFFNTNDATNSFTANSTSNTLTFSGAGDIIVNSRINHTSQTVVKEGLGRLTLGGNNSVITSGVFSVTGGALRITHASALGSTTGNTTVSSGASLELAFMADTTIAELITFDGAGFNGTGAIRNVSGNNTLSGILSIGTTALTTITADSGSSLTISGTLRSGATAAGTRTVTLGGAGTINITGAVTNGTTPATYLTALAKADNGTLNLRVASTYTGTTTARGGVLNLDFANAAPTSNLILSSNSVTLAGGTLQLTGKDGSTSSQSFANTILTGGRSALVVNAGTGGTANLALGTITRANSSGSAVNLTLPSSGAITTTTLNLGGNGILNGGMTVDKNTWATSAATQTANNISWSNAGDSIAIGGLTNGAQVSFAGSAIPGGLTAGVTYYVINATGSNFQVSAAQGGTAIALTSDGTAGQVNQAGAISGLTSYASTFTTNANVDVPGGPLTQAAVTVNSLRFNDAGGTILSLTGTLTSLTGGVLVTPNVAGDILIQSNNTTARTLSNSTSPADFTVHHHGTGLLTFASTLTLTNAAGFTKTGSGAMTFAATSSSASVQIRATEGTLNFVGSNRFTATTDPALFIGSATSSAKVSFGNGTTTGAESFTGISVIGTGNSLVGNGEGLYTISLQNAGTNDLRTLMIGGVGTNENNLSLEAFSGGTLQLGPANTYAGRNNLGRTTFEASVIANAGMPSSLGTGATVPTIDFHDTNSSQATVSTLRYVGTANATTDRAIRLITDGMTMPSLTAVVENNGTGTLKFTSAFTAAGTTNLARTLRLSGTNPGLNEIVSMTDGPSGVVSLDKAGTGRWVLTGNSSYTGGTTVSNGTLQLGIGGTTGMVGSGDIALSAGAILATQRSDALTISNAITGAGAVRIQNGTNGSTILTSNANTYSGGTWVSSGSLVFNNTSGSATGSGSVAVAAGASLIGSGRLAPAVDQSIDLCGILSIGQINTVAADADILTSGDGTLRINGAGVLEFDLISGAGAGDNSALLSSADRLLIGGSLTLETGSTLRVRNSTSMTTWLAGDTWQLFDWTTLTGNAIGTFTNYELPTLDGGFLWDITALYTAGTISISVVPEPTRTTLLTVAGLTLLLRRRRAGV